MGKRSLLVAAVGGAVAIPAAMLLVLSMIFMSIGIAPGAINAALAACLPTTARGPIGEIENPTPEEVAAIIYGQVTGWGYGDFAAMVAIHSNNFETTFQNLARGDQWRSGAGMTGSRGLFQQFPDAVPEQLRWSGKPDPGYGNDYGMYTEDNAWGPNGWAISDPRMSPYQATNMFILGKDKSGGTPISGQRGWWGMDNPTAPNYKLFQTGTMPTEQQAYDTMFNIQGFTGNAAERQSSRNKWPQSVDLFNRIKSGEITIPQFVPPMDFMQPFASDEVTRAKMAAGGLISTNGYTNTGRTTTASSRPARAPGGSSTSANLENALRDGISQRAGGSGLTLIGDSNMVGMVDTVNPPGELFGGEVINDSLIGVSLWQVVNSDSASFGNETANLVKWRKDIATGPDNILVQLGTNPNSSDDLELIREFMTIASGKNVFWFAQHYAPAKKMQEALEKAAGEFPNLYVIPVLDLMPNGDYQPAGQAGAHPTSAYREMWDRALSTIETGVQPVNASDNCSFAAGGAINVNPGSTPLDREDPVKPVYGYTLNVPGGRNMTFYSQADGRWNPSPSGYNFATCACGPSSMAMIVATLANKPEYTPEHAYREQIPVGGVSGGCGSYHDKFPQLLAAHGLTAKYTNTFAGQVVDWNAIDETLKKGGLVLASVNARSAFFSGQGHFVVIRGIAPDGRYLIADPNGLVTGPSNSLSAGFTKAEFGGFNSGVTTILPAGVR